MDMIVVLFYAASTEDTTYIGLSTLKLVYTSHLSIKIVWTSNESIFTSYYMKAATGRATMIICNGIICGGLLVTCLSTIGKWQKRRKFVS